MLEMWIVRVGRAWGGKTILRHVDQKDPACHAARNVCRARFKRVLRAWLCFWRRSAAAPVLAVFRFLVAFLRVSRRVFRFGGESCAGCVPSAVGDNGGVAGGVKSILKSVTCCGASSVGWYWSGEEVREKEVSRLISMLKHVSQSVSRDPWTIAHRTQTSQIIKFSGRQHGT